MTVLFGFAVVAFAVVFAVAFVVAFVVALAVVFCEATPKAQVPLDVSV